MKKTQLFFVLVWATFFCSLLNGQSQNENFRNPNSTSLSGRGNELNTGQPLGGKSGSTIVDDANISDSPSRSWQTYDISGYTTAVKSVPNPEKNVLDWILRETGTETWFGESIGVLSVGRHTVRCYHNAEVQQKVRSVIDRFLKTKQSDEVFGLQVLTIGNPNWRAKALRMLTRIETQSPGLEGWLATKEGAAQLYNDLSKRGDFNRPISPTLITESGQPKKILRLQPLNYFRSIIFDQRNFPPFRVETAQINEGFMIQFSSLRSLDGKKMDAEIFCTVDQVEQFRHVNIDVPAPNGTFQKHPISVPQLSSWRLKERFQWPVDRVLILSVGVVASPDRKQKPSLNIQDVFEPSKKRADALLFVDCKGLFPRGQAPKSAYRLVPIPNRR